MTGETELDELPDHVRRNRAEWDAWAVDYVANGERSWKLEPGEEKWGIWDIPESSLRLLPDDLDGLDAIELGCGTGYISAWLARRGARPVGIDNSEAQLATARRLQAEHGIEFPLIHGNAETVPSRTRASISRSPSTARASGPTRIAGFPRRRACSGPAASFIPGERNDPEPVRARRRGAGDRSPGASVLRAPPARVVD